MGPSGSRVSCSGAEAEGRARDLPDPRRPWRPSPTKPAGISLHQIPEDHGDPHPPKPVVTSLYLIPGDHGDPHPPKPAGTSLHLTQETMETLTHQTCGHLPSPDPRNHGDPHPPNLPAPPLTWSLPSPNYNLTPAQHLLPTLASDMPSPIIFQENFDLVINIEKGKL